MKLRPVMGILIICLMLQYSIGGLCANAVSLNDSGMANNSITGSENTTIKMLNATTVNIVNNTTSNYEAYPLNCPYWDNYKDKHLSLITNFGDYWDDLKEYVTNFSAIDDYNIQLSKNNYENNSGYFSGNPISGDMDYRYMPTSKLNEAYSSASVAKSRISIPNSLSTRLQATYTIAAVVLGAASGICGVLTSICGIATASTSGATSPILVVCIVITGMVVATTIAVGICTAVIASSSSGINVESGKIDNRLVIMNAELTYRSTLPHNSTTTLMGTPSIVINKTNNTCNVSENNKTLNNNTTNLNTTTNMSSLFNLNSTTILKSTTLRNSTTKDNKTNNTNTTNLEGNVIGINDVPPSTEPIPDEVTFNRTGTFMDKVYDIDMSGFPQKPSKPHPRWYEFWLWAEYGINYLAWCGKVVGWGFSHLDSLNKLYSLCKGIQSDYKSLRG
jgi:hypothetical protein